MTVLEGLTSTGKLMYCGLSPENSRKLAAIKRGIEKKEFKIYLQPICDLVTGEVEYYESLSRWCRPGLPVETPGEYIPLLVLTNNVYQLCHRSIERSAQLAPSLDRPLSINIYPSTVRRDDWVDYQDVILGCPGLRPKLEILETEEIEPLVAERIRTLSKTLWVSLDDFGTGFSTFAALLKLGLKSLKLDLSLIRNIHEAESQTVCKSVIQMAHALGLEVVAEGIETQVQREILIRLGCDKGQGYLFSRPQPVSYFYPALSDRFE